MRESPGSSPLCLSPTGGEKKKGMFYVDGVLDTLREVKKFIGKIPTADVQEVRHGKWIENAEDVYWGNHFIRKHCSEEH